jgi:FKBP-type peptidyl-prolyl cis-trans isomerase SlyD
MVQTLPRTAFAGIDKVEPGMQFQANTPAGPRVISIVKVEGDNVTVDANHPLAGVTLNFDVKIVDVRDASPEELSHGHVHSPGGHHH